MKKKNFRIIAKEVIDLEIKALQTLKKSLDKNFDRAVDAIVNCHEELARHIGCGGAELFKVHTILVETEYGRN